MQVEITSQQTPHHNILSKETIELLDKMSKDDLCSLLSDIDGYSEPLVDINQFVEDPLYLGSILKDEYGTSKLYPIWMDALNEIFPNPYKSPYTEIAFSGAIGMGKTTVGRIILLYDTYKLLMFRNPFDKFGLVSSDAIIIALFTANLKLADIVLYKPFREIVKHSPVFKSKQIKKNSLNADKGPIEFINNISIVAGSRFTHALGLAVFSGMLDEASFQIQGTIINQAYDSYTSLARRMESRFMEYGGLIPGHLLLISSKKDENAFLEKHIEQSKGMPHFRVFDYPIWDVKRHTGIYSGNTFKVFAGTALQSPRIVEGMDYSKYPSDKLMDVPVEYQEQFKKDIQKSLMEIAGSSSITSSKYIAIPEAITKSIKIVHCCHTSDYVMIDYTDDTRIISVIDVAKLKLYLNILPNASRYIHIDLGLTDDAAGIAMSCISGFRDVQRFDVEEITSTSAGLVMKSEPIIRTELAIGVKSLTKVPLWKIRDLITDLSEIGFPIVKVTADSWQSEDTLQLMEKMGYSTEVISVDRDKIPHITFRNALFEGRSELPENQIMVREFTDLVDSGKKFDHPTKGTKDISDAVVASHYCAFKDSGTYIE